MKRLGWRVAVVTMSAATLAAAAPPPPGSAVQILAPRFFPGWQAQNVCYPFVVADEAAGGYRMYYTGTGSEQYNDSAWDVWQTGSVTSVDTTNWKYPDNYEQTLFARRFLEGDLVDPDQQADIFDSIFACGPCVLKEASVYRMWYTGWNGQSEHLSGGLCRKISFRIGLATSSDGVAWTKVPGSAGAGAVLGLGNPGDQDAKGVAHPHVLKIASTYHLWYEGYDGTTWRLFHATSADGQSWTKQGLVLETGTGGALDELGLRNPVVIARTGRYELWYQGRSRSAPNYHVLRAVSNDGAAWTKVQDEVVLHPAPPAAGDEGILVDSALVLPDDAVQVFFARQLTTSRTVTYGTLARRNYYIYTEVVNP